MRAVLHLAGTGRGADTTPPRRLVTNATAPANDVAEYELRTEEDEARVLEERRKQREAILLRHREQSQPGTPDLRKATAPAPAEQRRDAKSRDPSPPSDVDLPVANFELGKREGEARPESQRTGQEISAAEYDPSVDRALDHEREKKLLGDERSKGAEEMVVEAQSPKERERSKEEEEEESEYEEVEVEEEEDIDDMFAIADEQPRRKRTIRVKKGKALDSTAKETSAATFTPVPAAATAAAPVTLLDNWDDPDGYYRITLGEHLGKSARYHVFAVLGRGMFSSVVKARDSLEGDREVAIKIVRSQETMYRAGIKEMAVLQKLASMDPEDRRHIIRLVEHFEHRNHLCMVFESLSMNLREVVKRFGKNVGLNLRAVRAYAHQIFLALALMRKAEIMHADLKPDNILVNESKSVLKICDLGSASDLSDMEITPYLVSRFYRAPEIILGMPYDCALDMWSIGCTLYELYTGKILFPGKSNNHMLRLMQELRGKFTTKQIRKGRFSGLHFDETNAFICREREGGGTDTLRKIQTFHPTEAGLDLRSRLVPSDVAKALSPADLRLTNSFLDLLQRTLELDPARRITPLQALQHAFFRG